MQITIKQPNMITESKAFDVCFDSFRSVMCNADKSAIAQTGESVTEQHGKYSASVYKRRDGQMVVNVYAGNALSPCVVAFCDEFDL